ncbi:MAG: glycosyltransferase family 4 protein [Myxococcales bacterium]
MKLLMDADTVGGVFTYAVELCRALGARGVEVALATKGASLSRAQRTQLAALDNVQVFESALKLEWMAAPWDDVARASDWLLALEAKLRPNIVHLNDYAHGALPFVAPVVVVGHSCVVSWFQAVKGQPLPPEWERYREEVTRGLQGADVVVAPSRAMLASLAENYGPILSGRVIHNARNPALFHPARKEPLVFAAGRLWDEAKNLSALEAVAGRLPWPVYVAGDCTSPDGGEVRPSAVNALGHLPPEQLAGWLGRAAIYAFPARYEPFGLSVLEAALSGCALVLGDVPSLRELWGEAALFVAPDDPDALRGTLAELTSSLDRVRELGMLARERARAFSPESMATQYLTIYRELTARPLRAEGASEDLSCAS